MVGFTWLNGHAASSGRLKMSLDTTTIRWHIADPLRRVLLPGDALPLAEWLRDGTATIVKDGPHRAVYRVRLPDLDCHVKHYRLLGWRSRVRQMLRPCKARREFALAADITARDVPTPVPLAWGVEGNGRGPAASWVITETVADAVPLVAFLEQTLPTLCLSRQPASRQRLAPARRPCV